ncbi:hypothetical protein CHS0354_038215 [Potamilus streckersoni]|uniref:Uncharacterized protein n=1 Tax=Potamilus streckersoni TaxID=2493646 RepID=A0AAE0T172_9BIVA|nr:hypothetical protein CHS0354_038215 [Potamilus streckersoni]
MEIESYAYRVSENAWKLNLMDTISKNTWQLNIMDKVSENACQMNLMDTVSENAWKVNLMNSQQKCLEIASYGYRGSEKSSVSVTIEPGSIVISNNL